MAVHSPSQSENCKNNYEYYSISDWQKQDKYLVRQSFMTR